MNPVSNSMAWNSKLPKLGIGIGYRDYYRTDVFRHAVAIDFLEITADHFFRFSNLNRSASWSRWLPWNHDREGVEDPTQLLDLLRQQFVLIPHGLSLSLGSAEGLNDAYLQHLKTLVERVHPPWWSEHIAFTKAGGIDIGHLTPLPKTQASLAVLQNNIRKAQDAIQVPLILENITQTIRFPQDTMDEAEFVGEIAEQNDCGILLDVTNLYINSINYGFDALQVLHRLPKERIVQLHFVGFQQQDEYLIDSHAHATNQEIWNLLSEVIQYADIRGAILERDERFPPFDQLKQELDQMRALCSSTLKAQSFECESGL